MNRSMLLFFRITLAICLMASVLAMVPGKAQAAAQVTSLQIPAGATITGATFNVYINTGKGGPVDVLRIDRAWEEMSVTWDNFYFDAAYNPLPEPSALVGSFAVGDPEVSGWRSVDATAVLNQWLNGQPNYGLMMDQDLSGSRTPYNTKESGAAYTAFLEVTYNQPGGTTVTVDVLASKDTYIVDTPFRHTNHGNEGLMYTGIVVEPDGSAIEKQALVWFDVTKTPFSSPGTGTPGYWKNHPEAWPVSSITIGANTYSKDQAIAFLMMDDKQDKTITLFRAYVAAYLNGLIGNDTSCVTSTMTSAYNWLSTYPVGSKVPASSAAWKTAEPWYLTLDAYNNGQLCAPHRD